MPKAPNSKLQHPEKLQTPTSNLAARTLNWSLCDWCFSGVWMLELGTSFVGASFVCRFRIGRRATVQVESGRALVQIAGKVVQVYPGAARDVSRSVADGNSV